MSHRPYKRRVRFSRLGEREPCRRQGTWQLNSVILLTLDCEPQYTSDMSITILKYPLQRFGDLNGISTTFVGTYADSSEVTMTVDDNVTCFGYSNLATCTHIAYSELLGHTDRSQCRSRSWTSSSRRPDSQLYRTSARRSYLHGHKWSRSGRRRRDRDRS